jgi:hypothetical protein
MRGRLSPPNHEQFVPAFATFWILRFFFDARAVAQANVHSRLQSFERATGGRRSRRDLKVITIPLHFTIVHSGKKGLLTAADVARQVKVLNDAYRGLTSNEAGFPNGHLGAEDAVDTKIGFVLAAAPTYVYFSARRLTF